MITIVNVEYTVEATVVASIARCSRDPIRLSDRPAVRIDPQQAQLRYQREELASPWTPDVCTVSGPLILKSGVIGARRRSAYFNERGELLLDALPAGQARIVGWVADLIAEHLPSDTVAASAALGNLREHGGHVHLRTRPGAATTVCGGLLLPAEGDDTPASADCPACLARRTS